jgi:hypothetical protein
MVEEKKCSTLRLDRGRNSTEECERMRMSTMEDRDVVVYFARASSISIAMSIETHGNTSEAANVVDLIAC